MVIIGFGYWTTGIATMPLTTITKLSISRIGMSMSRL